MPSRILRSFLYLDQQAVNDYLAGLGENLEDEAIRATTEKSGSNPDGSSMSVLKSGNVESREVKESNKAVVHTDAAKFQRLYATLERDEAFKYYEAMAQETWTDLGRNDLLELAIDLSLSKIGNLSAMSADLTALSNVSESFSGQSLLDESAHQVFSGIESLAQMEASQGIPVVMSLVDAPEYKFASFLNPDALRVEKNRLAGQFTVFGKVQRKLAKGEKYELFNPLKTMQKLQIRMNRSQRRSKTKDPIATLPEELLDTVKDPGAIITVIAIYK